MNALDNKNYTPAAYAEQYDHFHIMDRMVYLGGVVGPQQIADLGLEPGVIEPPKGQAKSPYLTRLCTIPVDFNQQLE